VRRTVLAVLLLPLLAACGVSRDREEARATTDRFLAALTVRDGVAACELLTAGLRQTVEKQGPCPVQILRRGLRGTRTTSVRVYALSGQARTDGGQTAFLDKLRPGWRLAAVGCTPAAPEEPYDCTLQH
jgi:hypothetical protein